MNLASSLAAAAIPSRHPQHRVGVRLAAHRRKDHRGLPARALARTAADLVPTQADWEPQAEQVGRHTRSRSVPIRADCRNVGLIQSAWPSRGERWSSSAASVSLRPTPTAASAGEGTVSAGSCAQTVACAQIQPRLRDWCSSIVPPVSTRRRRARRRRLSTRAGHVHARLASGPGYLGALLPAFMSVSECCRRRHGVFGPAPAPIHTTVL
jgi:hypothetical protein